MPDHPIRNATDAADALFDRYLLPKIALTVILAASLVGTWVSTTLSGRGGIGLTAARWAYFVALGVVTGGLVWKHAFVRPADLGDGAADYCAEMYDRFDRIASWAVAVLAVAGLAVLAEYVSAFGAGPTTYAYGAVLFLLVGVVTATAYRRRGVADQFRSRAGVASLALALALVVATAVTEVAMRGFDPAAAVVRVLHLGAFSVWVGGAVWNIFVAVPTGQRRPRVPVIRAAGEQLERFRWAVRFVIPTLFLTGLYQAADGLGTAFGTYLGTAVGAAVLAKVGFVGLLVVIFKICPMWRACSPIEGVCDLEDLGGTGARDVGGTRSDDVGGAGSGDGGAADAGSEVTGGD